MCKNHDVGGLSARLVTPTTATITATSVSSPVFLSHKTRTLEGHACSVFQEIVCPNKKGGCVIFNYCFLLSMSLVKQH